MIGLIETCSVLNNIKCGSCHKDNVVLRMGQNMARYR